MTTPDEILDFWFGADEPATQRRWFAADPEFDRLCSERFAAAHAAAAAGALDGWLDDARQSLALVLLLDQFPRNLFRDSPRAFATDANARAAARQALAARFGRELPARQRVFLYMPFQHSEALADQDESVRLTAELARDHPHCVGFLNYAERHRTVVRRFGRFPHRNQTLGRASTPEEAAYLRDHMAF